MRSTRYLLPLATLFLLPALATAQPDGTGDLPDGWGGGLLYRDYGFSGLIISKLNGGVTNLTSADVDGDGLKDLIVVNNGRAKIEFLLQSSDGSGVDSETDPEMINELADEIQFRREAYPTEEKVSAIEVADMDGDQRNDLVFLGDSGKLTIAYRGEDGRYSRSVQLDVKGASASWHALRTADIDQNGRLDIAVLGTDVTFLFVQDSEGRFPHRTRLPNATRGAGSFQVVDLNADGLADLLYVDYDSDWPFRYRLGEPDLAFGPEIRSRFAGIRSYAVEQREGGGAEILAIRRLSGRLVLLGFGENEAAAAGELPFSSLRSVPYEELKKANEREELLADLDGDGRPELIVAEPTGARVVVHHSLLGGGSDARAYPSFVGASRPRLGDLDGDGAAELVVAAPDEGAIGVSTIEDDGRIGFPSARAIPAGDDLLALDVADSDGDGNDDIWLALGEGKSKRRVRRVVRLGADGLLAEEYSLKDLKSDPSDMEVLDLNRDGRPDIMLFVPRSVPTILLAVEEGGFEDLRADRVPGLGILEGLSRKSLAWGDMDGDGQPELVVPGPNFARAFYLGEDGVPQVIAQFNLEDASAQVSGVGLGELDGKGAPEIVVFDRSTSSLHVLAHAKGQHRVIGKVDLGGLAPTGILVADLDGNGAADVLALAPDRFAVAQNGGSDPVFREVADLEVPIKEAYLDQIAIGDVNGDDQSDAVITESNRHLISISAIHADTLEYALNFAVFEQRIFERGGRGGREPREIIISDVTGDGLADIAILVHDRLIVYPQE